MAQANTTYPPILIGQLFPNPPLENGRVYVAFAGNMEHGVGIEVRSKEGEIVQATVHGLPKSGGTVKLDFSELLPDEYDVKIRCGRYTEHRSLTIAAPQKTWTWGNLFSWLF